MFHTLQTETYCSKEKELRQHILVSRVPFPFTLCKLYSLYLYCLLWLCCTMSGPGVCVCNSSHDAITWRPESRTHLSKQTRPSIEHSRKESNVKGIPSRSDDQLSWVLIVRSQV